MSDDFDFIYRYKKTIMIIFLVFHVNYKSS